MSLKMAGLSVMSEISAMRDEEGLKCLAQTNLLNVIEGGGIVRHVGNLCHEG